MPYEIVLTAEAVEDLRELRADLRGKVRQAIETYLRHEPIKVSRSRIKRLRKLSSPQYRLRVDELRIFYDVKDDIVEVLAIVPKSEAEGWLERCGEADEESDRE